MKDQEKVPQGIKVIATVNGIAAILHIAFWTFVFLHLSRPWTISASAQQIDLIVTYGLGVADLLWSVPFLIAGSIWLQKRWLVGWRRKWQMHYGGTLLPLSSSGNLACRTYVQG